MIKLTLVFFVINVTLFFGVEYLFFPINHMDSITITLFLSSLVFVPGWVWNFVMIKTKLKGDYNYFDPFQSLGFQSHRSLEELEKLIEFNLNRKKIRFTKTRKGTFYILEFNILACNLKVQEMKNGSFLISCFPSSPMMIMGAYYTARLLDIARKACICNENLLDKR